MDRGLTLTSRLPEPDRLPVARRAEAAGFDALFYGEAIGTNTFSQLSIFAHETKTIRLGVGVVNPFTRSPTLIAMSAAELDRRSDGRAILGLGAGTRPIIERIHGMPFEQPVARLSEYVDIIQAAWTGEPFSYDGEFYTPENARIEVTPVGEDPEIAVAANGPLNRRMTGEKADIWLPHLIPRSAIDDASETVFEAADAKGGPRPEVFAYVPTCIADAVAEARDTLREHVASYVGRAEVYRDIVARGGYETEAAAIHDAWQSGNQKEAVESVPDALVDDIGVAGTPEIADNALEPWEETCLDTALFHFPPDSIDRSMIGAAIDGLGPES